MQRFPVILPNEPMTRPDFMVAVERRQAGASPAASPAAETSPAASPGASPTESPVREGDVLDLLQTTQYLVLSTKNK
jgi:hypothetical protein